MKKTINFVSKYKYQILLIFVYLLFFIHMQNVYMYADDYLVAAMYRDYPNLSSIIFGYYYNYWSGRLIGHTITSIILGFFGINSFRILNPIFFFLFCYFISKIINIKNKFNVYKITFFITLIFLGLDIYISKELFYWADGTILYLWTYALMLIVIYFILDFVINKKCIKLFRFLLSILFIFIISFTMESTAIILTIFLFFVCLDSFIKRDFNKKIFILLLISIIFLLCSYLIPGNSYRLGTQNEIFFKANYLEKIIIKMPEYFMFFFSKNIFYIICIASLVISILVLKQKNKFLKILSFFSIISNSILIINLKFYSLFNVEQDNNFLFLFLGLYLIVNFIMIFALIKNENYKYYIYIIIGGILANLVSCILIQYTSTRFYFPLILAFIIFLVYLSIHNKEIMIFTLYLFICFFDYRLFLILLILNIIIRKFIKNENIFIKIIVLTFSIINFFNFSIIGYKYYENSKIFDYNEKEIDIAKKSNINLIKLKKIKYENYGFHLPPEHDYVLPWYKDYYEISNYNIKWID